MKTKRNMPGMSRDLIAYCGLYCGACSFKVAYEEQDREHLMRMPAKYDAWKQAPLEACPGCRQKNKCGQCAIRDCAVGKGIEHCGLCGDFPCGKLHEFTDDGIPHHAEAIGNLKALNIMGVDQWLVAQKSFWTCACGERYSWYMRECRQDESKKDEG
jgi:hypothetical protein